MNPLELRRLLELLITRIARNPKAADHLAIQLRTIEWRMHVTDDVFRFVCCGAEGDHAPMCPVRMLETAEVGR